MATRKKKVEEFELSKEVAGSLTQVVLSTPMGKTTLAAWMDGKGIDMAENQIMLEATYVVKVSPRETE